MAAPATNNPPLFKPLQTPSLSPNSNQKMLSKLKPLPFLHHHRHHLSTTTTTTHPRRKPHQPTPLSAAESSQVSSLFHLITSSPSPPTSLPPIPPSLLDSLLLRLRFSHSNPLRSLHFFNLFLQSNAGSVLPSSYDTMLYILGRARKFHLLHTLLLQMKRTDPSLISHRTLHIVLARIAKACSVRQTVDSFKKFKKLIHPFDTAAFNCLLRTLCQEKSMVDARNVYHSLKYQFRPNLVTFNVLLSGWKSVEDAEAFFTEMRELGVDPDLVTYNCLIDVYCKNREVGKARKLFDEMLDRDISPDVISYTSVIGGLGLIGQPDKAREVLKEMREAGCYPDVAAYNAAIRNYCIAKRMKSAFELMGEMKEKGLVPNATSYNLFFRVFYWANDLEAAWRLYGRMKGEGCLANTQSCMFLVRLFRRHENVGMAMELWGDMVEKGFGSFTLVSDVLFDMLCDLGKLDECEKCFGEMVEKGQRPSHASFRRIRVLMELAKREESIRKLEEMMASFGNSEEMMASFGNSTRVDDDDKEKERSCRRRNTRG